MNLKAHGRSDVGLNKASNEDAFLINEKLGVFIVCDGNGAENSGHIAAKMAINETLKFLKEESQFLEDCRLSKFDDDTIFKFVSDAIRNACKVINENSNLFPEYRNMSSTITMAITMGSRMLICNVGDSRAYLVSDSGAHLLSEDHTLVNDFVKKGLINSETDAPGFMQDILTRSLGKYNSVEVDCVMVPVNEGDKIVLCTDGISDYLAEPSELHDLIYYAKNSEVQLNNIIGNSLRNRGRDNATAIIIEIAKHEDKFQLWGECQIIELLQACEIFEDLSISELSRMRSHLLLKSCYKNNSIVKACEKYKGFYLILDGGIMANGELKVQGDYFGLKSLLQNEYSSNTKVAVKDT